MYEQNTNIRSITFIPAVKRSLFVDIWTWVIVIAVLAWPVGAGANGIEWSDGYSGTQPGPVKQSDLYLDEEHVVMTQDKVKADFWVMNPSDRNIKIQMGFPIKVLLPDGQQNPYGEGSDQCELPGCLDKKEVRVLVDGKPVPVSVSCPKKKGDNLGVIKWSMTYPAGAKTHFSVVHPQKGALTGGGEGTSYSITTYWSYIVHTGAYWSRPIGKARLEFCGPPVATYCRNPKGTRTWNADGLWQYDKALSSIKPQQSSTDCVKSCLVWERTDWVPTKNDDIEVGYSYSSDTVSSVAGMDASFLEIDPYCVSSQVAKANHKIRHFAESTPLAIALLDNNNLEDIFAVAAGQRLWLTSSDLENLPEHVISRLRLSLYRYLRNWLAANHGHEFKDPKLRACYETVPKRTTPFSAIELKNMEFLKKQEKIWEEKDRVAWKNIRNNQEPKDNHE